MINYKMPKIIIDENIAYAEEAFGDLGEIQLVPAHEMTNANILDADALIVRSTAQVDESLLRGSAVKFVGTATIGTDHIDLAYLQKAGIAFASAAGCNADAVAEYVFTSLAKITSEQALPISEMTIGVVGVGNVGSRVVRLAKACGMNILQNDPPLARTTGDKKFVELADLEKADIITLHVPLTKEGQDKTWYLFDAEQLNRLRDDVILINASRGAVVNNRALLEWKKNRPNATLVLDVWENEPEPYCDLMQLTKIASPHIAGYSLEGKANGTWFVYREFCRHFALDESWRPNLPRVNQAPIPVRGDAGVSNAIVQSCLGVYNILQDDKAMRAIINKPEAEHAAYFHKLRKEYPLRREFFNYSLELQPMDIPLSLMLRSFRFQIKE
ncbi:MAG: 4-phosphoerythronate dehydrogenase [Calditrichaeota bacterium]|nr:MAG: 4-phosphoerythronate dehydrogenase [Calditrichota bacterium]